MTYDIQYSIEAGAMHRVARPMHKRPWLMFFCFLIFAGIGAGGVLYFYRDTIAPQGDTIRLSRQVYDELVQKQQTQDATNALLAASLEMSITPEQLRLAFDETFGDVRLSPEKREAYLKAVATWSTYYAMPPLLVLSMIWRESTFDETTISSANARGPMQVIYRHHAEKLTRIGKKEQDLHTIDVGVHVGIAVLREYFDRYDKNIFRAMTAYVGGQHRTYAQDIMTRYFKARIFLEEHIKKSGKEGTASSGIGSQKAIEAKPAVPNGQPSEQGTETPPTILLNTPASKPTNASPNAPAPEPAIARPAGLS